MRDHHSAGLTAARFIQCLAVGHGHPGNGAGFAMGRSTWRDRDDVLLSLRAIDNPNLLAEHAMQIMMTKAPSDTLDLSSDLGAIMSPAAIDVAAMLRPVTLATRILGIRQVPMSTQIVEATDSPTASWVDENAPTPVAKLDYSAPLFLTPSKVALIIPISMTLARMSEAAALIRDDLRRAVSAGLDAAFVDTRPALGDAPAAINHGAHEVLLSGSSVDDVDAALRACLGWFADNGISLGSTCWITSPTVAAALALKRSADGSLAYPAVNSRGGELAGLALYTSDGAVIAGSPREHTISLLDASAVAFADGGVELTASTTASLQMSTSPSAGAQQMISLWARNLLATRVVRIANWSLRRQAACAVIRGAEII